MITHSIPPLPSTLESENYENQDYRSTQSQTRSLPLSKIVKIKGSPLWISLTTPAHYAHLPANMQVVKSYISIYPIQVYPPSWEPKALISLKFKFYLSNPAYIQSTWHHGRSDVCLLLQHSQVGIDGYMGSRAIVFLDLQLNWGKEGTGEVSIFSVFTWCYEWHSFRNGPFLILLMVVVEEGGFRAKMLRFYK